MTLSYWTPKRSAPTHRGEIKRGETKWESQNTSRRCVYWNTHQNNPVPTRSTESSEAEMSPVVERLQLETKWKPSKNQCSPTKSGTRQRKRPRTRARLRNEIKGTKFGPNRENRSRRNESKSVKSKHPQRPALETASNTSKKTTNVFVSSTKSVAWTPLPPPPPRRRPPSLNYWEKGDVESEWKMRTDRPAKGEKPPGSRPRAGAARKSHGGPRQKKNLSPSFGFTSLDTRVGSFVKQTLIMCPYRLQIHSTEFHSFFFPPNKNVTFKKSQSSFTSNLYRVLNLALKKKPKFSRVSTSINEVH